VITQLLHTEKSTHIEILLQSSNELPTRLKNTLLNLHHSTKDFVLDYSTERNHYLDRVNSTKDIFTAILDILDYCNIDPNRVTFLSGNYLISENYERYCDLYDRPKFKTVATKEFWLKQTVDTHTDISDNYSDSIRPYYFSCLNGFARPQRIQACEFLFENNLIDKSKCTFMFDRDAINLFYDKSLGYIAEQLPIEIQPKRDQSGYHMCHAPQHQDFYDVFYGSYFDVITETSAGFYVPFSWWKDIFYTEKLWRSIFYKRPFLLIGDYKALDQLKKIGFKTFENILFDESYDNIFDPEQRVDAVLEQTKNICSKYTIQELHDLLNSSQINEVLEFNYNMINKLAQS